MRRVKTQTGETFAPAAGGKAGPVELDRPSFFQRPFVQTIVPFLTSFSVHAAILIVGLLTYTAITIVHPPEKVQVVPATTDFRIPDSAAAFIGNENNPFRKAAQNDIQSESVGSGFKGGAFDKPSLVSPHEAQDAAAAFDIGTRNSLISGNNKRNGDGDGNPLPWEPMPQIGGGPMFSPPVAHRIVYLCDASGSMINKMASLKMELAGAVNRLSPTQNFSIIFFQGSDVHPDLFSDSLTRATPENKRKAGRFLEGVTSTGSTEPIAGIDAAFRQNPELIYLLTDGDFSDNDKVLARIRSLNKEKKVRIHTIAFVDSNDHDVAFIEMLKTIAAENGGTYRHVAEEDLGR